MNERLQKRSNELNVHMDRAGATASGNRGDSSSGRRGIDGVGVVLDIGAVTRGSWPSSSGVPSVLRM